MTLENLFDFYKSDKGTLFDAHGYARGYEQIVSKNIDNLLEIGIGADGIRNSIETCGSVRAWLDWLPNTKIHGFDIKDAPDDLKEKDRFNMIIGDQSNPEDLIRLKKSIPDCEVIIDDGSHLSYDQILTFYILWNKVKAGGFYIIEDVHCMWGDPPHTLQVLFKHKNFVGCIGKMNQAMVFKK